MNERVRAELDRLQSHFADRLKGFIGDTITPALLEEMEAETLEVMTELLGPEIDAVGITGSTPDSITVHVTIPACLLPADFDHQATDGPDQEPLL